MKRFTMTSTPESAEEAKQFGVDVEALGVQVTEVTPDNREALYVCNRGVPGEPGYFDDDEFGYCAKCQSRIRYRPHAPKDITKVCSVCVLGF